MNRRLAAIGGGATAAMLFLLISTRHHANVTPPAPASHLVATTSPAPTTMPTDSAALPEEFAVLATRSPFGHGHHAAGGEESLVFKGVMQSDDRFTAFIEDISSNKVIQLAAGDAIARGRIKNVDLDSIEYEATGKSQRVEVGQNLMGQVVAPTPTSKPAGPNPGGDGQAGPPGPPGMSPDQMTGQPMPRRGPTMRPAN